MRPLISLAALVVYALPAFIPIELDATFGFRTTAADLALGAHPFFSSFAWVAGLSGLIPRFRRQLGDAQFHRRAFAASIGLGLLFAAVQSYAMGQWARDISADRQAFVFASAIAFGSALLSLALAHLVTKRGFGNGFVLFLAYELLPTDRYGQLEWHRDFFAVALLAAGVYAYFYYRRLKPKAHLPAPPKAAPELPIGGLVPVTLASAFASALLSLENIAPSAALERMNTLLSERAPMWGLIAVCVLLVGYFAQGPTSYARDYGTSPKSARWLVAQSLVLALALNLLPSWIEAFRDDAIVIPRGHAFNAVAAFTFGAILLDLALEAHARRQARTECIAHVHRTRLVEPLLDALREAGIEAHAAGHRFRALMLYIGAYGPVRVLVAPRDAQAAKALAEARLNVAPPQTF